MASEPVGEGAVMRMILCIDNDMLDNDGSGRYILFHHRHQCEWRVSRKEKEMIILLLTAVL